MILVCVFILANFNLIYIYYFEDNVLIINKLKNGVWRTEQKGTMLYLLIQACNSFLQDIM